MKLTIIGAGAMGSAFAGGMISAGIVAPGDVTMVDVDRSKLETASSQFGVSTSTNAASAVLGADVVMLAVKPWIVKDVLPQIRDSVSPKQLVVSIVTGVRVESIESGLPDGVGVIRAMPNTPCLIRAGAVGFACGKSVTGEQIEAAKRIFDSTGISVEVPEHLLNAVTGLSGSGPAYIYLLIEALIDGGVRVGLPRDTAFKLASQTVMGAARMVIERNEHPAVLKDQVTTPGGTTIAALDVLEKTGFRSALIEAVKASTKRSEELA